MKATIFHAPGDVRVEEVPDPAIKEPTDAIVRVTHACICGSDLWFYRGLTPYEPGWRTGHEWMGIVEEAGPEVRTIRKGDRVIAPFAFSDGDCEFCRKGLQTSCLHAGFWGMQNDGGQGEMVRAPYADSNLVVLPQSIENDAAMLKAVLPLTDVMGTGHHAAVSAGSAKARRLRSLETARWDCAASLRLAGSAPNASSSWDIVADAWNWPNDSAQPTSS